MLLTLSLFASASDVLSIEPFQAAPEKRRRPNKKKYIKKRTMKDKNVRV
jgi:hypothetical protein